MGAAITDLVDRQPLRLSARRSATLWSGTLCGSACLTAWISTALPSRWARWAVAVAVLIAATFAAAAVNHRSPLRYATFYGGVVVMQTAVFASLGIPPWRMGLPTTRAAQGAGINREQAGERISTASRQRARADTGVQPFQFAVVDLLAATTALGLLLGMARQYSPPLGGDLYWIVTGVVWLWLSCVSAGTVTVVFAREKTLATGVLIFTVALALMGLLGLGLAERRQHQLDPGQVYAFIFDYAAFPLAYMGMLASGSLAGRYDRSVLELRFQMDQS